MDRLDDLKLPADTPLLQDTDAQAVCAALGGRVYFVGGCVRDALLGRGGADIDMATPFVPQEVTRLCQAAGLKVVPTGIDHGTATVVSRGKGFEVTTFRRDVETDGRRAVVAFSTDIVDDARRRDFTLNALYATPDGRVVDPLGGVDDCLNRRIRFIEDAGQRIREDYLRILRFFRFHAWYANPDDGFDTNALDAIAQNSSGLETLSAERVGMEMRKLLSAPDPARAVAALRQTGAMAYILPGSDDRFLAPLIHLEGLCEIAPDALLRLAVLGGEAVADRLRLSRIEARRLDGLIVAGFGTTSLSEIAYRSGADLAKGAALIRAALSNTPVDPTVFPTIDAASDAVFPVTAADLLPAFQGRALGERLADLERRWIASDFTLTRSDLLQTD